MGISLPSSMLSHHLSTIGSNLFDTVLVEPEHYASLQFRRGVVQVQDSLFASH